ncbi:MAG: hypothetical protein QT00_C0001G0354 [archaeon GW2011_AR5]|nr:MAG: hypothetical protein QT00_C0001G0354 [archaeon GW2011_AR5]
MPKKTRKPKKKEIVPAARKNPGWLRHAAVATAALGTISAAAWNYASSHYERKWSELYKTYESNLTVTDRRANIEFSGLYDKLSRVRRLHSLGLEFESDTKDENSRFLVFLKNHHGEIAEMANTDFEFGGYLMRNGDGFRIAKYSHLQRVEIMPYSREVLNGNFSNAARLKEHIRTYSGSLGLDKKTENIALLAVDYFQSRQFNKELDESYRTILESVAGLVQYQTPHFPEDTMKTEFFAGWHIHPRNIPHIPKSPDPDVANTFIIGPEVIFQINDSTLQVYGINQGRVKEIYRVRIN